MDEKGILDESILIEVQPEYLFSLDLEKIAPGIRIVKSLQLTVAEIADIQAITGTALKAVRESGNSRIVKGPEGDGTETFYDFMQLPENVVMQIRSQLIAELNRLLGDKRAEVLVRHLDRYGKKLPELRGFGKYKVRVGFSTRSAVFGPGMTYTEFLYDEADNLIGGALKQSDSGLPEKYKNSFNVAEE